MSKDAIAQRAEALLSLRSEGVYLDFKKQGYADHNWGDLADDVACLHNGDGTTVSPFACLARPAFRAAYLVIGANSNGEPCGYSDSMPDETVLRGRLGAALRPCPEVTMHATAIEGKQLYLLEIAVGSARGPVRHTDASQRRRAVRCGSSNATASCEVWTRVLQQFHQPDSLGLFSAAVIRSGVDASASHAAKVLRVLVTDDLDAEQAA